MLVSIIVVAIISVAFYRVLKLKHMENWLLPYIISILKRPNVKETKHVLFCFVDHYEPQWRNDDIEVERARVDRWCKDYREMAKQHQDADGVMPQHSFFYPEEEYRYEHLAKLSAMCHEGFGEIEIHLHHHDDTKENFIKTITDFAHTLHHKHGALPVDPHTGEIKYAFIHGNWALDNSRADGMYCGIDNEIKALADTGCYVDMTLPSSPSDTQTSTVNSIYYATGKDGQCKSHDKGVEVEVGKPQQGELMLIQGPIGINYKWRNAKGIPHIENADVRKKVPPIKSRIDHWVKSHIHVKGRPEWIFIKVHTHGTQEEDMDTLLGQPRHDMHSYLEEKYNDGTNYVLHYVSAREMYNIAKAAEAGKSGNPNQYRDFYFAKPTFKPLTPESV
ncbi:hypothetical protein [Thalassotalea sp. LPB0316]|uniref:hypothetical protein n=1 Tax=Thalassotalea sp. LPB0316 TaxID=2769490 RepID=UPI001D0500D2|nr:hypothetical protein [Thalassotalea sp. LPB0316]